MPVCPSRGPESAVRRISPTTSCVAGQLGRPRASDGRLRAEALARHRVEEIRMRALQRVGEPQDLALERRRTAVGSAPPRAAARAHASTSASETASGEPPHSASSTSLAQSRSALRPRLAERIRSRGSGRCPRRVFVGLELGEALEPLGRVVAELLDVRDERLARHQAADEELELEARPSPRARPSRATRRGRSAPRS